MKEKRSFDIDDEEGGSFSNNEYDKSSINKAAHDISSRKLNEYMFKMVRKTHMDFELARFIMIKSILSPQKLYLHTKRSK